MLQGRQPFGAKGVAFADAVECLLPLGVSRPGSLGEDHRHLVVAEPRRQVAHSLQLSCGVGGLAVEEVVGQPVADDVEAGVGEQLPFEHVARVHPGHRSDHPGAEQGVGEAGVATQQNCRPGGELAGLESVDGDPGGDPQCTHQP